MLNKLNILVFVLLAYGLLLSLGFSVPKPGIKNRMLRAAQKLRRLVPKKPESAKEYVLKLNGRRRENFLIRSRNEAKDVFQKTGQNKGYAKVLRRSVAAAVLGVLIGILFSNVFLSFVLGAGLYFIPLWMTRFSLYRYNRFLNDEFEVALSLITTSYVRNSDILGAVEENLGHINSPVKELFASFVNNVKYVDPNVPAQIERMKGAADNKLFRKWCDSLILCQDDHTLRATLIPIVNSFSDLKAQQMENETNMMKPLRQALFMTALTVSVIPMFLLLNKEWYANLVGTIPGKIVLVITGVAVLTTINKAIRLSKPIEYDV
ncbi:MAG: hypothetical protein VB064_02350 [Oscillospiraceae bacterium]|nr:hypothetical protein [Oscillospiraceae bacterium]